MKKLITLVVAAVLTVAAFADNLPAFTEAENAYVFDAKKLDEDYGDGCKIVNLTFEEKIIAFPLHRCRSGSESWKRFLRRFSDRCNTAVLPPREVCRFLRRNPTEYRSFPQRCGPL